jgi:Ca2+-binding EF-hand superfamily protein
LFPGSVKERPRYVSLTLSSLVAYRRHSYSRTDTISVSQTKQALKRIAIDVKTDEVQRFLGQGLTDLDEKLFIQFGAMKLVQIEKAQNAFALFDKDEKGVVVFEDLQRVAQELGEDFTNDELTEMVDLVDRSGDGLLSPKDFAKIAKRVDL